MVWRRGMELWGGMLWDKWGAAWGCVDVGQFAGGCCGACVALFGESCFLCGVRSGCALCMSQRPGAGSCGSRGSAVETGQGREVWGDVDGEPSPGWGLGGKHGVGGTEQRPPVGNDVFETFKDESFSGPFKEAMSQLFKDTDDSGAKQAGSNPSVCHATCYSLTPSLNLQLASARGLRESCFFAFSDPRPGRISASPPPIQNCPYLVHGTCHVLPKVSLVCKTLMSVLLGADTGWGA